MSLAVRGYALGFHRLRRWLHHSCSLLKWSVLSTAAYEKAVCLLPSIGGVHDLVREDCRTTYQIVAPTTAIVDLACHLLERHPLRGYDAMHLATALTVQQSLQRRGLPSLTFLCADDRLNAAASAESLAVDNPNNYPQS